jgi:hypothetical protein
MIDYSAHDNNSIAVLTKSGVNIWNTESNQVEFIEMSGDLGPLTPLLAILPF